MPSQDTGGREGTPAALRPFALRERDVIAARGGASDTGAIVATVGHARTAPAPEPAPLGTWAAHPSSPRPPGAPRGARGDARAPRAGSPGSTRRLADLSVSRRLIGLVAVLGVVWAACMGLSVQGLTSSKSKAVTASEATNALVAERNAYEGWLTDDDQSNMAAAVAALPRTASNVSLARVTSGQVRQGYAQARSSFATLDHLAGALGLPASFLTTLRVTEADLAGYNRFTDVVLADVAAWNPRGAISVMTVSNLQISNKTQADFNALNNAIVKVVAQVKSSVVSNVGSALLELLVLALLGIGLAAVATRYAVRSITRPLGVISATLEDVAAGDLTARAGIDSSDEIGTVARGLDAAIAAQERSHDESEQRSAEDAAAARDARGVAAVLDAAQAQHDPDEALRAATEAARRGFDLRFANLVPLEGGAASGDGRPEPARTAIARREVVVAPDGSGPGSVVIVPVVADGSVVALLELATPSALDPGSRRVESFANLATCLSAAVDRLRAAEREHAASEELRTKVNEILSVVNAAAAGDLTVAVPVTG
ncbi:MAG TPA: HAMP domain-containing protein, partial [Acidimicrobiales bacterium]|nr:HAMP domain-containing protein [Acidimicrobiales bacterium]